MKYAKKKKKSPLVVVLWLLTALLAVLVAVVILLETGNMPGQDITETQTTEVQTAPPEGTTTAPAESLTEQTLASTEPAATVEDPTESTAAAQNRDLIELETPYCVLYFPGIWEDILHINPVEEGGYRMEFGCRFEEEIYRLFDISFGTVNGAPLGWVTAPGGEQVQVSLNFHEPDESLKGDLLETFLAMQDDANQLIALLPLEAQQQTQQPQESQQTQTGEDIVIETPFCVLTYPGRWEDYLQVEHTGGDDYRVDFLAAFGDKEIPLFSLKFRAGAESAMLMLEDAEGNPVGVNIEMPEVDADGLTREQLDVVHSMQDALNDMLDALMAE